MTVGLYHWGARKRELWLLLGTAGVFCAALVFRTVDRGLCAQWPLGTHFLWHLLNGLVAYLAMRSLVANRLPGPEGDDIDGRGSRGWILSLGR